MIFYRLDRFASDEFEFHKPRHGDCGLCEKPRIDHPCWSHRWHALIDMTIRRWP